MENNISVVWQIICSCLFSGLIGNIIAIIWSNKREDKRKKEEELKFKRDVFQVLMANRFNVASEENVKILNCIEVIYYDYDNVLKAYDEYFKITLDSNVLPSDMEDKYLILLEEIAKVLNYDKIHWEKIKRYYISTRLLNKIKAEDVLNLNTINNINNNIINKEDINE